MARDRNAEYMGALLTAFSNAFESYTPSSFYGVSLRCGIVTSLGAKVHICHAC
jgi:hypothetical protein